LYGSGRKTFPDLDKLLSIQVVDEVHNDGEDARCQSEGDDFDRHDRTSDVECLVSREVARSFKDGLQAGESDPLSGIRANHQDKVAHELGIKVRTQEDQRLSAALSIGAELNALLSNCL
jgi:hypothetical protein